MRLAASLAFSVALFAAFGVTLVHAQTCPNPGERPATVEDIQYMKANDFPVEYQVVGRCWDPNNPVAGVSTGEAKQKLEGMWCGSARAQCSYNGMTYSSNTEQLDPKFATCAVRFMEQLRQQDPTACIRSAFRSTAHQACACENICHSTSCPGLCAPPGQSYHQKGLAIDVNHSRTSNQQFWYTASLSGLGNPKGLHVSDPDHLQVMNGGENCASIGYQPVDTDMFIAGPQSSNPYFSYGPNPMTSMQPIGQPTSSGYPTQTQPSTQTQNPQQGQLCSPKFSCTSNVMYYQTSSCTTEVYQVCSGACNAEGTACGAATSTPTSSGSTGIEIATSTDIADTTSFDGSSDAPSVSDQLDALANQVSFGSTDIGTATPLTLNPNTGNIANLGSPPKSQIAEGTILSTQPPGGQQTFVSGDLGAGAYVYGGAPQGEPSALASILEGMKQALLHALDVLRGLVGAR